MSSNNNQAAGIAPIGFQGTEEDFTEEAFNEYMATPYDEADPRFKGLTEETIEGIRRLEFFLGPNSWARPATPAPAPEPSTLPDISDNKHSSGHSSVLPRTPPRQLPMNSHVTWPVTGLAKGERPKEHTVFVPWKLVKTYPEMYIGKTNAQRAKTFFDNPAIHKHHPWDFFYIYNPGDIKGRHILLVPTYQFEYLLEHINDKLDILLTIPGNKNAAKFNVTFGLGGAPVPRFLGRSANFEEFEALEKAVPPYNPEDDLSKLSTPAREDFLELVKSLHVSTAGTKTKKSEKKRIQRIQDHRSWGKSTKRVQRYLGIRKQVTDVPTLETLTIADTKPTGASGVAVPIIAKPERGVIFVAIDIEAFEFSQGLITEIGVAVFDTLDINNKPPGDKGKNWFDLIRGHHYRVKENAWATNSVHVDGNADKFDFGKTEFIPQDRVEKLVIDIIENPLSLDGKENKAKSGNRPVVLVFHDSEADTKYLEKLEYDVKLAKNVLEIVDTRDMYQHSVKANQPTSLERVLAELQFPSRFLHNAGNDAVYTMQAMIGLAFKLRQKSLERAHGTAKGGRGPSPGKPKDDEGWLTGGEDSDGGKPNEKGAPDGWTGGSYLRGKAFQPGEDVVRRAPSPQGRDYSWSDNESEDDRYTTL